MIRGLDPAPTLDNVLPHREIDGNDYAMLNELSLSLLEGSEVRGCYLIHNKHSADPTLAESTHPRNHVHQVQFALLRGHQHVVNATSYRKHGSFLAHYTGRHVNHSEIVVANVIPY